MKFQVDWLCDLLDGAPDADTLAERLTGCGFLVELREEVGGQEVWDVEVTTNRPDAMNHRGLAREAAVATGAKPKALSVEVVEGGDEETAALARVEIADETMCSRFAARVLRKVRLLPSPEWMQRRLASCGVRPINAVVDVTNYLLLELGQPLHAYDLQLIRGRTLIARRATAGETLTTLDGERRRLDDGMPVIADLQAPVGLAGIMGGADSEIGDQTVDVLLEGAHFDALSVRRTARRLGMHTEASHRFERGADPEMPPHAVNLAAAMIAELTGATVCRGLIDVNPRPWRARELTLEPSRLSAFAGVEIGGEDVVRVFDGLGFAPTADGDRVTLSVPSWRVDVERISDLYEEVIRHVGYDRVPAELPVLSSAPGRRHPNWELVDRGRYAAVGTGLAEVMTYSFVDPDDDAQIDGLPTSPGAPLALTNPLARTQGTMRRSLLTGLMAATRDNLNRGELSLAIFEQGRVFGLLDGEPCESERLAVVLSGPTGHGAPVGFGDLKGAVESILERAGFPAVAWRRGGGPWLDEAEGALMSSGDDTVVGYAGMVAPALADRWELKQPVYIAELDLGVALQRPALTQFQPLPRFPAVVADMTVEHPRELSWAELEDSVRELAGERVEAVELVVQYSGKGIPSDAVRTTVRLVYRHPERSLTQDEVNEEQNRLRDRLADRLGVRFA